VKPKAKKVSARDEGGAVARGFSPILSPSSESFEESEECSDSTISSTASPVALAKKIKNMVKKMNRKADKRDQKIDKSYRKIIGMFGQIKEEFKYLEVLVKDRAVGGYDEKYKDLVVSIPLLTQDFTKNIWGHFVKLQDRPPQPKYYKAFGNSLFKLLMFFQDNGHWVVPSKEKTLYNWVKNQRNFMRQYEYSLTSSYMGEFPKNQMIINSAYYYLLKDVVGLPSSKFDPDGHQGREIKV
jgi:hypothetical protein